MSEIYCFRHGTAIKKKNENAFFAYKQNLFDID